MGQYLWVARERTPVSDPSWSEQKGRSQVPIPRHHYFVHLLCAILCAWESKLNKVLPQSMKTSLAYRDYAAVRRKLWNKYSTGSMNSRKGIITLLKGGRYSLKRS